jgi:hypothetical protein
MESGSRSSFSQRFEEFRPSKTVLFWSCAACVVLTMIVGFSWGGWVTGGTAQEMVEEATEQTTEQLAAALCVQRFVGAQDAAVQLAALKEITSSYRQSEFIEDGGWATLPGADEANAEGADICAERLAEMELPAAQEASAVPDAAQVAQ